MQLSSSVVGKRLRRQSGTENVTTHPRPLPFKVLCKSATGGEELWLHNPHKSWDGLNMTDSSSLSQLTDEYYFYLTQQ